MTLPVLIENNGQKKDSERQESCDFRVWKNKERFYNPLLTPLRYLLLYCGYLPKGSSRQDESPTGLNHMGGSLPWFVFQCSLGHVLPDACP